MEHISQAYDLKATVVALKMLDKNTKAMVSSPNDDMNFCDIIVGVLQGDILAPYLFILSLDYILWTSIDVIKLNGFSFKKDKMQMLSHRIYDSCRLCRWSSASCKYTCPSASSKQ